MEYFDDDNEEKVQISSLKEKYGYNLDSNK